MITMSFGGLRIFSVLLRGVLGSEFLYPPGTHLSTTENTFRDSKALQTEGQKL
jgi:hypothetical protein